MLNWVAVLRRILHLYNVNTQQDLGMALGVPVHIGVESHHDTTIPWHILELVVADKHVSWDWLMTGRHFREAGKPAEEDDGRDEEPRTIPADKSVQQEPRAAPDRPPSLETRELVRALLPHDHGEAGMMEENPETGELGLASPAAASAPGASGSADPIAEELERIKTTLLDEIERVKKLLEERDRAE